MSLKIITIPIWFYLLLLLTITTQSQTTTISQLQKELTGIKDSTVYVDKINRIAMLLQLKNPDSCFIYGFKAKNIAQRNDYQKGIADANNVMAIALSVKGMQHNGMKLFKEALSGYKQISDTSNIVQVYMNLSVLFSSLEDKHNMKIYSDRAMQLGKKIPNDSIMAILYSNYVLANGDKSQETLKYYRDKSNAIAKNFKDPRVLLINRLNEISVLINKKDKKAALPILDSILDTSRKLGIEYAEIEVLSAFSHLYDDEPQKAIKYSEEALSMAENSGYTYITPLILQEILHYAELAGDTKKQLEISKKLVEAVSIQQRQTQLFLGDYIHLNDVKEKNIALQKQSKENKWYLILLCVFLIICIIFIFITIRLYKKSQEISRKKSTFNRAIRGKNKKLKEADDFKNRLVSILAHDFRSPMISTIQLVDILSSNPDLSKEEMDEFYETIKNDVSIILNKFDITLQWILQQLSGYKLKIEQHQLSPLIDEVIHNFSIQSQTKKLNIINSIDSNISISTDKEMLQFINRNIISNAIKFSPIGGEIKVEVQQESNNWIISISDQGKGLSPKVYENLFSVADLAGSTKDGAGIALSMCKDFITKLGGKIDEKNNVDGGATFIYTLPII